MNSQNIKSELVSNLHSANLVFEGVIRAINQPSLNELYSSYKGQLNELAKEEFLVAVTGTVSAGKSSFVNALLGRNILTRSEKTTTKVATKVRSVSDSPNGEECFIAKVTRREVGVSEEFEAEFDRAFSNLRERSTDGYNGYLNVFYHQFLKSREKRRDCFLALDADISTSLKTDDPNKSFELSQDLKSIFTATNSRFPITAIIEEEIQGTIDELEPFLTNTSKKGAVTDICVYVDSPILSRGVTLVDLPGSDARFDEDKEITHSVLNDEALSAVIFTYVFGKDALSEDAVIADYINENILSKGNRLFLVFNKTDQALSSVETRNTHVNETLRYFDSKFQTRDEEQIKYYYLSAALNEGMSFGINPSGEMSLDHTKIIEEIKRIAKADHKLKKTKKSEAYQHFFNAFASCLKQLPKFQRPLTGKDDQEGVLGVLDELSPEDLRSIYNLEGLDEILSCAKPDEIGMSNLYEALFDYLTEGRIIDVYKRVLNSWNNLIAELQTALSETTSKLDSFGSPRDYKRDRRRDFKDMMRSLSDKAPEISQRFHQRRGSEIDADIGVLLEEFNRNLSSMLSEATKHISYDEIVSALKSEYQQVSAIPSYLAEFASSHHIAGYEFGYKQENIYAEAVLLALINALQMLTRYKAREMITELPDRVLDHLLSWLMEPDTQAQYFNALLASLRLDSSNLYDSLHEAIEEQQLREKTLNGIDDLLHTLYYQSGTKSIYSHLLKERDAESVQDMLTHLDQDSHFIEIKKVFDEINTEQIRVGFNQFKDEVERYLRDWHSKTSTPFFRDLFSEEGQLYQNYNEILEESLDRDHGEQFRDLKHLCDTLERSKEELEEAISNAGNCYRRLSVKLGDNSLRDFEQIGNVLPRLLKQYAEVMDR